MLLSSNVPLPKETFKDPATVEASRFVVFLVADLDAIEPVYHELSLDFCFLEAGYMARVLLDQDALDDDAARGKLAALPFDQVKFGAAAPLFVLKDSHKFMSAFVA